jgi:hypothetical protein
MINKQQEQKIRKEVRKRLIKKLNEAMIGGIGFSPDDISRISLGMAKVTDKDIKSKQFKDEQDKLIICSKIESLTTAISKQDLCALSAQTLAKILMGLIGNKKEKLDKYTLTIIEKYV